MDAAMAFGVTRKIAQRASQHRPRTQGVSVTVMVQCDGYLNQPLQEPLLRLGGGAPNVFEGLVGLEKGGAVEQLDPLPILLEIHAILSHVAARLSAQ